MHRQTIDSCALIIKATGSSSNGSGSAAGNAKFKVLSLPNTPLCLGRNKIIPMGLEVTRSSKFCRYQTQLYLGRNKILPKGLHETRSSKFCQCQRHHFARGKVTSSLRACFIYLPIPHLAILVQRMPIAYKSR